MVPFVKEKKYEFDERKSTLLHELDEAIDSMEQGRTLPHEEAMNIIRKKVEKYIV